MDHGVTQTGTVLGTGEYLAPEQASGKPVSPATDVYSLGVVLWELLAGDVPFVGDNFVAVALRHVNEAPPSLRERRPDVSPRLDAAVQRALAKDPARRFPSMAAFAKELRICLAEPEGAAAPPAEDDLAHTLVTRPPAPAPPPVRRQRRVRRRRGPLFYLLLALLVGGAAFAAVVLLGGTGHHGVLGGGGGGSSGKPVQLHGLAGYDPPPGDGVEGNAVAGQATDGSTFTSWSTETYRGPDFAGLKTGVGLVLSAGRPVKLAHLTLKTPTPGFTAEIQAGDSPRGGFSADSPPQLVDGTTKTFDLDGKTARYYVIWITKPSVDRMEISEVTAKS
jgi:hypothetical protein